MVKNTKPKSSRLVIDIDGIIFEETGRWDDFHLRKPIPGAIEKIKALSLQYDIILYTARKSEEGFWPTIRALIKYGLDEHVINVVFDKPIGIKYIDDKSINNLEDMC